MPTHIRLGTRASPLALAQTDAAKARLIGVAEIPAEDIETVTIRTTGDQIQDRALADIGGKALFVRELDRALLAGKIDIAVHSAKDLPGELADGIIVAGTLPRGDPADALVSRVARTIADLPSDTEVGTSSPRRQAQLHRRRRDLRFTVLRGNIETRLDKTLAHESNAATLLAMVGLNRLGVTRDYIHRIDPTALLPALGQGVIALTVRRGDDSTRQLVQSLTDPDADDMLAAERGFLQRLGGDCHSPIAGLAEIRGEAIALRGEILSPDGADCHRGVVHGPRTDAADLGIRLGNALLRMAGTDRWVH